MAEIVALHLSQEVRNENSKNSQRKQKKVSNINKSRN